MEPIPEDIKQFLAANVEATEQLEILRILAEDPAREWSAAALAVAVQAQPPLVLTELTAMHGRGLLTAVMRGSDPSWRHGPASADLADKVNRLLQLYAERPVTLINLVHARARERLRTFAEAFRIRKEG